MLPDSPDFDPKLILAWPGTPEVSRRRIKAGLAGETTICSASFPQMGSVAIFAAAAGDRGRVSALVSEQWLLAVLRGDGRNRL